MWRRSSGGGLLQKGDAGRSPGHANLGAMPRGNEGAREETEAVTFDSGQRRCCARPRRACLPVSFCVRLSTRLSKWRPVVLRFKSPSCENCAVHFAEMYVEYRNRHMNAFT